MSNIGGYDGYKWGFKTREDYIKHLQHRLDKVRFTLREAKYQLMVVKRDLEEEHIKVKEK